MKQPTDQYFAGLFDGEGTFCAVKRNEAGSKFTFRAVIAMCDEEPIYLFGKRFSGNVTYRTPQRIGWKGTYRWEASGWRAVELAEILRPYLIVKKRHALLLIEAKSYLRPIGVPASGKPLPKSVNEARSSIAAKLAALNRKGA